MSQNAFQSRIIADVGISFGDEGKGRVVYEVVEQVCSGPNPGKVAMVLKANGGANSGHTAGGLKHNLLPCGIADTRIPRLVLGSGVVADPRKIWWEVTNVDLHGYQVLPRLFIDERTLVSDLCHRLLDLAWEHYRSEVLKEQSRGSTGRGITPAFSDEVNQWQIFYDDFRHGKEAFATKLARRAGRAMSVIEHTCRVDAATWDRFFDTLTAAELRANRETIDAGKLPIEEFDFNAFKGEEPFTLNLDHLTEVYWKAGTALLSHITDVRELVLEALDRGDFVLCEFGQSYWLDKRHGFTPNVTASHTFTPELFQSAGIPLQPVHTIGVCKAYDTKVGTHVFLSEMQDGAPLTTLLKKLEFGTSTGRQRMVGWFDAVEKGSALRYGGYQDLVINKIDALTCQGDWQGPLKICVAYEAPNGQRHHRVPRNDALRQSLKPVYIELEGWTQDISQVKRFDDLPLNAKRYIAWMLKSTHDCANHGNRVAIPLPNVRFIGVGPDQNQVILDLPDSHSLLQFLH
jgi:adenylosuccinate synthase